VTSSRDIQIQIAIGVVLDRNELAFVEEGRNQLVPEELNQSPGCLRVLQRLGANMQLSEIFPCAREEANSEPVSQFDLVSRIDFATELLA